MEATLGALCFNIGGIKEPHFFTIVFSLEMVHKPNIFMYKSTLKMTDLQGRILSSWLFSFIYA
jgi:hypothetical protein